MRQEGGDLKKRTIEAAHGERTDLARMRNSHSMRRKEKVIMLRHKYLLGLVLFTSVAWIVTSCGERLRRPLAVATTAPPPTSAPAPTNAPAPDKRTRTDQCSGSDHRTGSDHRSGDDCADARADDDQGGRLGSGRGQFVERSLVQGI